MNMISIVNEAINRKLQSMSFTDLVVGKVESINPLKIRINDRIVIGQSFIEPMSLGIDGNSPNFALPLIVGDTLQMIRYNNGQRFYILGVYNFDILYPPGTVYEAATDEINPAEKFGGEWAPLGEVEINNTIVHKWVKLAEPNFRILLENGASLLLEDERRLLLENE